MDELVNIIINNGVAIGMVIYFAWRDVKFMQKLDSTLDTIKDFIERKDEKE